MNSSTIQTAIEHWQYLAPILSMPKTEAEYETLVTALDEVLDAGGSDENHPLAQLADRMGDLVAHYEDARPYLDINLTLPCTPLDTTS